MTKLAILRPLRAIRVRCTDCSETRADVRDCPCSSCDLWRFRMGKRPRKQSVAPAPGCPATPETLTAAASGACRGPRATKNTRSRLRAIRRHCLDCADGNAKYVLWCTQDGLHAGLCPLWPYRLGVRPATAYAKFPALLMPELMPGDSVCLDDLLGSIRKAIHVP